jgi:hypothetical protein
MSRLAFLLVLVGCSGEATPAPALACSDSRVETPDGERLLVTCNRDVPAVPDACELVAASTYQCNWLHATAEQCDTFPGICK